MTTVGGDQRDRSSTAELSFTQDSEPIGQFDIPPDQHDAFCIATWLARADRDGTLAGFLKPGLSPAERAVAQVEGWILGVPGLIRTARKSELLIRGLRSKPV
jgi:hypothetical protein